jgi:hypothetical protein
VTEPTAPKVFISYSHKDVAWKDRVLEQLIVLEYAGQLTVWDDQRIEAGDEWLPEIEAAMKSAEVAVLLVSADFLNSAFIRGTEIPRLLARRQAEGLRVIPVFVRPCAWKAVEWLAALEGRPKEDKTLSELRRHQAEKHLADLALEIGELLGKRTLGQPEVTPQARVDSPPVTSPPDEAPGTLRPVHADQGRLHIAKYFIAAALAVIVLGTLFVMYLSFTGARTSPQPVTGETPGEVPTVTPTDTPPPSRYCFAGSAKQDNDATILTPNEFAQSGGYWLREKVSVVDGFETTFSFEISHEGAEGFAFVIQNTGCGVGADKPYVIPYHGLVNSLAIEFDTWPNPNLNDPSRYHVAVNTNGRGPNSTDHNYSLATAVTSSFADGEEHRVKIRYLPGTLRIYLDNLEKPLLDVPVDIDGRLELDNGRAWVGFVGGTGTAAQMQRIKNWKLDRP